MQTHTERHTQKLTVPQCCLHFNAGYEHRWVVLYKPVLKCCLAPYFFHKPIKDQGQYTLQLRAEVGSHQCSKIHQLQIFSCAVEFSLFSEFVSGQQKNWQFTALLDQIFSATCISPKSWNTKSEHLQFGETYSYKSPVVWWKHCSALPLIMWRTNINRPGANVSSKMSPRLEVMTRPQKNLSIYFQSIYLFVNPLNMDCVDSYRVWLLEWWCTLSLYFISWTIL